MKKKSNNFAEKVRNNLIKENTGLAGEAMDAFSNVAARMGYGTSSLAEATEYELVRWTNNYWLMITLFRNHWISRRIVEKPAQDMTKAWPVIQTEHLDTGAIQDFDRVVRRTYTPTRIKQAITWARLFGGAGALIVIDGQEGILDKPLKLDDVNPGSYKGLIVFDRWSGITPSAEICEDIDNPVDFNMPLFYRVQGESQEAFQIHHSRILRFVGPEVPRPENQAQMHWGISELEIAYEEMRKRDNASWSILSLMFRAQILAQKNPALATMLSGIGTSGAAARKFAQVMEAQNQIMSNQSMLLMGADSSIEGHAYTFGGIAEVYQQFQMDIAGAAKIPVSILFGRTVTGIGQSNDADIRIYEQEIAQKQTDELRPQLDKLYPVICMSEFGEVPDDLDMIFPSIRVLTEEQKTENAGKVSEAVLAPYNAGVTSAKLTLQELKAQSDVTGIFTNITDEMIEDADDQPVLPMEVEQGEARAGEEFEEENEQPVGKGKGKGGAKDERLYDEITVQGLPVVIETKQDEIRIGKDFKVIMPADYGFIKGTIGADGDEIDCYVGPNIHSKMVYVINQRKIDGSGFDEHKCMLGFDSQDEALLAYGEGHHRSDEVFMSCKAMNIVAFKLWLRASAHTEAVSGGATDAEFNESDHPRDEMGRFGTGAGHTNEARQNEIKRLKDKYSAILSTPLYSEGGIGPAQTARFSQKQFKELQEKQQLRLQLQSHIKQLSRSDNEIASHEATEKLKKINSRRGQLNSQMENIKSLGTMSHKPNGDLKKGYQLAWDDCVKQLAKLEEEETTLAI